MSRWQRTFPLAILSSQIECGGSRPQAKKCPARFRWCSRLRRLREFYVIERRAGRAFSRSVSTWQLLGFVPLAKSLVPAYLLHPCALSPLLKRLLNIFLPYEPFHRAVHLILIDWHYRSFGFRVENLVALNVANVLHVLHLIVRPAVHAQRFDL